MVRIMNRRRFFFISSLLFLLLVIFCQQSVLAQSSRPKKKSSKNQLSQDEVRAMDSEAEKLKSDFLKQMSTLAIDYAKGGEYEKSKKILRQLNDLSPSMPGVREKIKQLNNALLSENEVEFEYKITNSWGNPQAFVLRGKKFRIRVEGKYKFVSSATVSPTGFPNAKPPQLGMTTDIPCGALMGLIVEKGKKIGKPFYIGAGSEISPKKNGALFLRVNTPLGSKSSGRLKIKMSGAVSRSGK